MNITLSKRAEKEHVVVVYRMRSECRVKILDTIFHFFTFNFNDNTFPKIYGNVSLSCVYFLVMVKALNQKRNTGQADISMGYNGAPLSHCQPFRLYKNAQVGNDQEMAQSERNSHSINRGVGKKLKWHLGTCTKKTYSKPSEQLFPNRRPLSYLNWTKIWKRT